MEVDDYDINDFDLGEVDLELGDLLTDDDSAKVKKRPRVDEEPTRPKKKKKANVDDEPDDLAVLWDESDDDLSVSVDMDHGEQDQFVVGDRGDEEMFEDDRYGDEEDFDDYTEQDRIDRRYSIMKRSYEPSLLQDKYITPEDEEIKIIDVPERLLLHFNERPDDIFEIANEDETIRKEAEWIYRNSFMGVDEITPQTDTIEKIGKVLSMVLLEKLEIPFISMYRTDQWLDFVYEAKIEKERDLWEIFDMDVKWFYLLERRTNLARMYQECKDKYPERDLSVIEEHADLIEEVSSPEEINDFLDYFHFQYPEVEDSQYKQPSRRDKYSFYKKKLGLKELTKQFGISADQLGQNLSAGNYARHKVVEDPIESPDDLAFEYITTSLNSVEDVLKACRFILAKEVAYDPQVRQAIRRVYWNYARISTEPTTMGKRAIDSFHRYRVIKRLKDKPADEFKADQFMMILEAEKNGFITKTITISEDAFKYNFLSKLEDYYLSDGTSELSEKWNNQRRLILEDALKEHILPLLESQLISRLKREAQEQIINKCTAKLERLLMAGPYIPRETPEEFSDEEEDKNYNFKVLSCSYGGSQENTVCVVLDDEGEVLGSLSLAMKFNTIESDHLEIANFLRLHRPHVTVVGADGFESSRKLFTPIQEIVKQLQAEGLTYMDSTVISCDVGNIFKSSNRANLEFPQESPQFRRAVSLGRRLIDPLTEMAGLCNRQKDILCMNLHPMMKMVDSELLNARLERVFQSVVTAIGVDINRVMSHTWQSPMLNFIPGLGPRKSSLLLNRLQMKSSYTKVSSRAEIFSVMEDQENVYTNMIASIKLKQADINGTMDEFVDEYEILDITRIHPDDYEIVQKLAEVTLDDDDDDSRDGSERVEELMRSPEKLENLDTEDFCINHLRGQNRGKLHQIKNELNNPFNDFRIEYQDPTPEEYFYMLTGETQETLRIGMIVNVRPLAMVPPRRVKVALDCGLIGYVEVSDLLRTYGNIKEYELREDIKSGSMTVQARITDLDEENVLNPVYLSASPEDLESDQWDPPKPDEIYLIEDGFDMEESEDEEQVEEEPQKVIYSRAVVHQHFKNIDAEDAEKLLENETRGEVVIRPSSKGYQTLAITWKFYDDIFVHIEIKEDDKENDYSLGKRLLIGGEVYADLNDVIVNFVGVMDMYVDEMINHEKFKEGERDVIELALHSMREVNPMRIPYLFGISTTHPGRFLLYYLPAAKCIREYISITPKGFRFRSKVFDNINHLLGWFKRHYQDPIPTSRRERTHGNAAVNERPPPPPNSYDKYTNQGYGDRNRYNNNDTYSGYNDGRRDSYNDYGGYNDRGYNDYNQGGRYQDNYGQQGDTYNNYGDDNKGGYRDYNNNRDRGYNNYR
eukprot:TRINITY_DN6498_c0_g1_i1.p1 TRINITY_DN6498_c0_g1~~TRINITY_DN6498_c0_g1_i1.p1  ORF type:complete len:1391 (-),score=418.40 TRINITY_DN6498_c0_g1_i1:106-4233(-)